MTVHALLFEAESIQAYITDSGRLADAVGASARVDQLCGDLLDASAAAQDLLSAVLRSAEVSKAQVRFSRRGGGAFIALFEDEQVRGRVQALWSAALAEVAPGLRFGLATASASHALEAAQSGMKRLRALRNQPSPVLPEAGPLTRRAPRTGRAAVRVLKKGGADEWVDAQTAMHSGHAQRSQTHDALTARFSPALEHWPRNLDTDFPFLDNGHREIAMVHADGNGLGVVLQALANHCKEAPDAYIQAYAGFSGAVTRATRAAAAAASREVLEPATQDSANGYVPARPLVLGGDDLTILLRPDLAVPFTEAFLLAFEQETAKALKPLREQFAFLPERLSAAAGIAIVSASHPFDRAMHLAEALCKVVKAQTKLLDKIAPSGLMLYRQTVSLLDDWDEVLQAETTPVHGQVRYRTVHGPYLVTPDARKRLPALADLRALRDVLDMDIMARGPVRHLITQLHHTPHAASQGWHRVWEMLERRDTRARDALVQALQGLGIPSGPGQLPCALRPGSATDLLHTPVGDALTLAHLGEFKKSCVNATTLKAA
jgi:hypothetical protein